MRLTILDRGLLRIEEARIAFRNFRGIGNQFNREGDRNFAVVIPDQETADILMDNGWNVKIKPAREEGDTPFMFLTVKIKFNSRGPRCYVVSNGNQVKLREENVGMIDTMDIDKVDMIIRPYDWEMRGSTGRTAYLEDIEVLQRVDYFAARYAGEEFPEE